MKAFLIGALAAIAAVPAFAQTVPATYPASGLTVPQPGENRPVLGSDLLEAYRITTVGGAPALTGEGALPLSDFAFAADVAKTNASVATALGGGATVNAAGQITAPTYSVQGVSYNSVGSAIGALDASLTSGLNNVSNRVSAYRVEARQGIAAAMAMSTAPMPSAPGRTSWTVNAADFAGEIGYGAAVAHRFNMSIPFAVTAAFSSSRSGETGGRIGLAGEF